jgi:hypothetical protein
MPPEPSGAEVKERLKSINKTLKDLIDLDLYGKKDWSDVARILRELHETKMKLMEYFPASYGVSFRRWYDFFSEFDKRIDKAVTGSEKEDHSEDFVPADLTILLQQIKDMKDKIEADLKVDGEKKWL